MITMQQLRDWVDADKGALVAAEKSTVPMFQNVVFGLLDMVGDTPFGLLSEMVAATKPVNADGKPIKGSKADATTAVRASELRQIVGAIRAGMPVGVLESGRVAAVDEARAWLKTHELTAKGEPVAEVQRRTEARKMGKAASALFETGAVQLTNEQMQAMGSGTPLALVITPEQQAEVTEKARLSVEADRIKAKLAKWEKKADDFAAELLKDGIGEDAFAIIDRILAKIASVAKGEPAMM